MSLLLLPTTDGWVNADKIITIVRDMARVEGIDHLVRLDDSWSDENSTVCIRSEDGREELYELSRSLHLIARGDS